ncbi:MAG: hypothetical protein ACPGLY_21375, partial [Rubripirellula sp.]
FSIPNFSIPNFSIPSVATSVSNSEQRRGIDRGLRPGGRGRTVRVEQKRRQERGQTKRTVGEVRAKVEGRL